jgi:HAMP domain-containing protein
MAESTTNSQKRFVSLRVKIWLGFILIFTPVFVASYFWFYQYTTTKVMEYIQQKLVNTVEGAIKGMDVDGFVKLYQEETAKHPELCPPAAGSEKTGYYPEDNPLYLEHENWLKKVMDVSSPPEFNNSTKATTRLYTYVKGPGEGDIIAIGSTGYFRDPRGGFKFCELYNSAGKTRIADGLKGRVDTWKIYTDKYGSWITTYAPIVDSKGKIVGAIGVDISASYVEEVRNGILVSGAIAFIISYVLIFFLVYLMSGVMTRPIVRLEGVAREIGDGNYEQDFSQLTGGRTRDEIGTLTDVFAIMVSKVYQREQTLRQQVEALKIVIDETKRQMQVNEIAETDFFRDLQQKARDMRGRKTKK